MVADRVVVETHKAGESESWRWESDGQGSFTIAEAPERPRGTRITLYLKDDAKDYLDKHKLGHIVRTYSDHVGFPITLTDSEGHVTKVNEGSAIWTRAKSEITDAQYQEFYRQVAHTPEVPWAVMHNKAEGAVEYTSLLFIPGMKPFDLFHPERRRRLQQGQRHRVRRTAQTDRRLPGSAGGRDTRDTGHDDCQGSGPERVDQPLCERRNDGAEGRGRGSVAHVDDERVIGWPALGGKDAGDRPVIVRPRTETVDGLGGEGDEFTGGQRQRGLRECPILVSVGDHRPAPVSTGALRTAPAPATRMP
jgi:hypothetical protein